MRFPLYQRPNALVFLDDDAGYLEMLALVMPKSWYVRLYTHVDDCVDFLQGEKSRWDADVWSHQQFASNWQAGTPLVPQILNYWAEDTHRYGLTKIFVVDFSMPAITGLDVLKKLPSWPPGRLLLTGKADESIAIGAFNQGLIDMFLTKQQPDIGKHLTALLADQQRKPLESYDGIWKGLLKKRQFDALQEVSVQVELLNIAEKNEWVEYVVVPAPFGILGLDKYANANWLQLELQEDLAAAADLAQATGQSPANVQKIRAGSHLLNTELLMTLDSTEDATLSQAFQIGEAQKLVGAHFKVPQKTTKGTGHHEFLLSAPPRSLAQLS